MGGGGGGGGRRDYTCACTSHFQNFYQFSKETLTTQGINYDALLVDSVKRVWQHRSIDPSWEICS